MNFVVIGRVIKGCVRGWGVRVNLIVLAYSHKEFAKKIFVNLICEF